METIENEVDQSFVIYKDEASLGVNFPVFQEIRHMDKFSDVILMVNDNVRIPAHRVVLAATSPYFYGMFANDTTESRIREVTIEGVEASALKSLINYVYTGEVRIDTQNVENLIRTASYLLFSKVEEACADFIISEMTPHNVLGIRELADTISYTRLLDSAKNFVAENFNAVSETEEFSSLELNKFLDLIERSEINVPSEDIRFSVCMKWIKYDKKQRISLLPTVLTKICLKMLSSQLLTDCVKNEELICNSTEIRDSIEQILAELRDGQNVVEIGVI